MQVLHSLLLGGGTSARADQTPGVTAADHLPGPTPLRSAPLDRAPLSRRTPRPAPLSPTPPTPLPRCRPGPARSRPACWPPPRAATRTWPGAATPPRRSFSALEEAGARAQQEFVAANLGLVGAVLGPYAAAGAPVADLFQEGCLGLIAAVVRFDHRRGVRFSTYATYWVRTSVSVGDVTFASAVTVPVSRSDQLRVAHGVRERARAAAGAAPHGRGGGRGARS